MNELQKSQIILTKIRYHVVLKVRKYLSQQFCKALVYITSVNRDKEEKMGYSGSQAEGRRFEPVNSHKIPSRLKRDGIFRLN